jgi:HK97 gp10 family phage protein
MSVEVEGVEQLEITFGQFNERFEERASMRLTEWAETVRSNIQSRAPVRTGLLSSLIYITVRHLFARIAIGDKAFYAKFIEHGTKFITARPFFHVVAEQAMPQLVEAIRQTLQEVKEEMGLI